MLEKKWKKIIINNKETFYSVSNYGEIRNDSTGTLLKGNVANNGYRMVHIKNRIDKYCSVHRLVAKAFMPCENMDELQINHKDGNKLNNYIENLEWCTPKENIRHSFELELQAKKMLPCHCYDLEGNYIKSYVNALEASEELNVDYTNVLRCMHGEQSKVHQWQFRDFKTEKIESWCDPKKNKVYVYSDDGTFLKCYESQGECAKDFAVAESSICRYIKRKGHLKGFVFSRTPL